MAHPKVTGHLSLAFAAIAGQLRQARTAARQSLDALAAHSGVSQGTLVNLVSGRGDPSVAVFLELWRWTLSPRVRYEASAHSPGTREVILGESGHLGLSAGSWSGVLVATDLPHC